MSVARTLSAALVGLEARPVVVETAAGPGLPGLTIVGLPDAAVKESRERIRAALRHIGFPLPGKSLVVNLAPADLPKSGTALDLPLAVSILAANGDIPEDAAKGVLLVGELALDGALRPVPGVLPIAELAGSDLAEFGGVSELIVPLQNGPEAAAACAVPVRAAAHLGAVLLHLTGRERLEAAVPLAPGADAELDPDLDLAEVRGQAFARRALEIAAAGGHNILMCGSPGAGKTMLARRLAPLLPPLSREEALETTRIWSVAGRLPPGSGLLSRRPFRAPHHGASAAALSGGGSDPRPGELSLAHHGVLFLDELPEFRRDVLEALREPLEEGVVTVARASGARAFPARFLLVAAMNPCSCGYRGDPRRDCICSEGDVVRYRRKISGPLLDRIDLHVDVAPLPASDLRDGAAAEASASVRARVLAARARQAERSGDARLLNATTPPRRFRAHVKSTAPASALLEKAVDRLALSARAHQRVLRVARTIADLEAAAHVDVPHVAEALRYRAAVTMAPPS